MNDTLLLFERQNTLERPLYKIHRAFPTKLNKEHRLVAAVWQSMILEPVRAVFDQNEPHGSGAHARLVRSLQSASEFVAH
jgi:hypothetical protein